MQWAKDNADMLVIGAVALVQILNASTQRWDKLHGSWPRRLLLMLTEMSSVLTSRNHVSWLRNIPLLGVVLGRLKLPLNPYGGKEKTRAAPPGSGLMLVLLGGLVLTDGCAATWDKNADKAIRAAHETAKGGWEIARKLLHERCLKSLSRCDTAFSAAACPSYTSCAKARRDHATAFSGVQEMIALAADALGSYRRLTAQGSEASQSQIAATKAEVMERVDRAERASVTLLRRLSADGLTHDE